MKLYAVALLVTLAQFANAQHKKQKNTTIIPFKLTTYNNIVIQAIINHTDTVNLMFHTAANAVTLTEEAVMKLKTVHFKGSDSVKSWGGADNISRYSESNTLQIGGLTWEKVPIWENKNSGQFTDGKFGLDLFKNKVIAIDFEKNVIQLYATLPSYIKQYQKLPLTFKDEMMFVEASCVIDQNTYQNKYLIHSGYAGAILFDDQFVAEHKIDGKLKIVDEKQLKDSFGNVLKTKKAILPTFLIGKIKLDDVPASFFTGALGRQKISIIGGDLLKRYQIIINAERTNIYLKPNKLAKSSYSNV